MNVSRLKTLSLEKAMSEALVFSDSFVLVPVGAWILEDVETVAKMADWRSRARDSFLSQVDSSSDSMLWYLQEYSINDPNRILFLIKKEDEFLGHLGLSSIVGREAEIDNVMKAQQASRTIDSSQFLKIFVDFLVWAQEELGVQEFSLQVVSTNVPAIRLYRRAGFEFMTPRVGQQELSQLEKHSRGVPSVDSTSRTWMRLSMPTVK